eukprot:TRINITY_DN643_c0_g4_i3.p1 TRINITY_DN643_c0_g4~~TRINITY_DN643_c0_g4_i3.p1  ORF type:complete len:506 (+),score=161.24 TRINITY_DN643_c0_g4_i3:104-1519(+)
MGTHAPVKAGHKQMPSERAAMSPSTRRADGPLATPPHTTSRFSPLSVAAEDTNYRGLFHLSVLVLVAVNVRLVVENVTKYGVRISFPSDSLDGYRNWPCSVSFVQMWLQLAVAWFIERLTAPLPMIVSDSLHFANTFGLFASCWWTVNATRMHAAPAVVMLCFALCFTMKLLSFWHGTRTLRYTLTGTKPGDEKRRSRLASILPPDDRSAAEFAMKFPRSMTLTSVLQFGTFPTLVWQTSYPRTSRVQKRNVIRYAVQVLFCISLIVAIIEQYITPLLFNAKETVDRAFHHGQYGLVAALALERLLKLVVPNLYVWLVLFCGLFHSWLNLVAEVTRFGDRQFYQDWWNATSFREYWQKWNLPVRDWFRAHVYRPLRRKGVGKSVVVLVVFLISGALHEFVTVVPLHLGVQVLVTLSFVLQLPLFLITDTEFFKRRPVLGNCMFWFVFCVAGQPVAVLVYFFLACSKALEGS